MSGCTGSPLLLLGSLVVASRGASPVVVLWFLSRGFSGCGTWTPCTQVSAAVAHELSRPETCGILVSGAGIEPEFPAPAGGFLTNGPPGKPQG